MLSTTQSSQGSMVSALAIAAKEHEFAFSMIESVYYDEFVIEDVPAIYLQVARDNQNLPLLDYMPGNSLTEVSDFAWGCLWKNFCYFLTMAYPEQFPPLGMWTEENHEEANSDFCDGYSEMESDLIYDIAAVCDHFYMSYRTIEEYGTEDESGALVVPHRYEVHHAPVRAVW